jgi:ABC-type bacteriocin/lantibiotic exporter with double-glycine peptidase domain
VLFTILILRYSIRAVRIFIEVRLKKILNERVAKEIFANQITRQGNSADERDSANLIRDLNSIPIFLQAYVFSRFIIFEESILILGVILVLFFNSPIGSIFVLSIGGFVVLLTIKITGRRIEQAGHEYVTHQATHIKFYSFIFRSIKEIFVYGKRESATESFELNLSKVTRAEQRFELTHKISPIATESIIVTLAIFTLWVAKTASDGNALSLSFAIILATGAFRLLPSLGRVSSVFQVRKFEKSQAQILFEYLDNSSPSTDLNHTTNLKVRNLDDIQLPREHSRDPSHVRVELKNVNFSYSPSRPQVISNLSCTFETGSVHLVRGVSGVGKSTLLNLIMGYTVPQTGEILINQTPVRSSQIFRNHRIAYVPQSVTALDFSISENITLQFGRNEEIDESKLQTAIIAAGLSEFVESLPEGVLTPLGEMGSRVSGGQLQRIGLARALYRESRILLLDEATSNLDYETEAQILSDLSGLKDHRLIILVSHSSHAVKYADKILEI